MKITETNVYYLSQLLKYGISHFPILFAYIFMEKKLFVKFNEMRKIVGQNRGENIKGGGSGKKFFLLPCPRKGKSETAALCVLYGTR